MEDDEYKVDRRRASVRLSSNHESQQINVALGSRDNTLKHCEFSSSIALTMRAHSFLPLLALGRAVQGAALDGIRGVSPRDVLTSNALQASGHIDDLRGKVESRDLCLPCAVTDPRPAPVSLGPR